MSRPVRVRLIRPLERTVAEGHPWVYRDALAPHEAAPGTEAILLTRNGNFLARGYLDAGPIGLRVLTTRDEPLAEALVRRRFEAASELRDRVVPAETTAYRLVHGEGDRLPGVVVDVYGEHAVMRLDGEGATARREAWIGGARPILEARGIRHLLVRTGRKESVRTEVAFGSAPADLVAVRERGTTLLGDLLEGQKTGLFLDHRESRFRVRALARGLRVLNLYGYTGGFSVSAGLGGATHVTTVDVAKGAIELSRATWEANGLAPHLHDAVASDVPDFLAASGDRSWDLIVADPPNFAPNARSLEAAKKSYESLHASCLARLAPGGYYLAASCSSHVDMTTFQETLSAAARRSRRVLQILERTGAPADHPRLSAFPEGDYLKVILARAAD